MKLSHIIGAAVGTAAVAPVAVCLGRALANRPTAAANAKIEIKNDDRAIAYGQRLSKMVRCETISSRDDQKVEKFLAFHEVLAELFPTSMPPARSMSSTAACSLSGRAEAKPTPSSS